MKITLLTGKTFDIQAALGFEIKVIRSPLAKRLTLRVDSKERLPVLTLPPRCSEKKAVAFVKSHEVWLKKTLEQLPPERSFQDGETLSLFGRDYTVRHRPDLRCGVRLEENCIFVSGSKEFLHRRLCDFIKKQAAAEFLSRSKTLSERLGCYLNGVTIKDTKSRWGSCSNRGNINYNWRIALAPDFVIDYLMAHECAHLRHQDHSPAFWNCVRELCPDYKKGRLWLKNQGRSLYLFR